MFLAIIFTNDFLYSRKERGLFCLVQASDFSQGDCGEGAAQRFLSLLVEGFRLLRELLGAFWLVPEKEPMREEIFLEAWLTTGEEGKRRDKRRSVAEG